MTQGQKQTVFGGDYLSIDFSVPIEWVKKSLYSLSIKVNVFSFWIRWVCFQGGGNLGSQGGAPSLQCLALLLQCSLASQRQAGLSLQARPRPWLQRLPQWPLCWHIYQWLSYSHSASQKPPSLSEHIPFLPTYDPCEPWSLLQNHTEPYRPSPPGSQALVGKRPGNSSLGESWCEGIDMSLNSLLLGITNQKVVRQWVLLPKIIPYTKQKCRCTLL